MSKMLSKMNLISVVQQLPSEDIETIQGYVEMIKNENEELKKQLKKKYSKIGTLTNEVLYEENTKLINQQQKFIKYLEDKINKISKEIKHYDIWHEVGDINFLILKKQLYKEILQKYKEIIGNDINVGSKGEK